MTRSQIRSLALAGLLTTALTAAATGPAFAGVCDSELWFPPQPGMPASIPNCTPVAMPPLGLAHGHSTGWAYYCPDDTPYYWGLRVGYSPSFSVSTSCISVAENSIAESEGFLAIRKFDATFANWCGADFTFVVTIACSDVEPAPDFGLTTEAKQ